LDLTREILSRASLIFCSSELQISAFKEINQKVVFLPDSFPVEEYQLCKIHGTTKTVTISWVGQASTAYQLAVVSDVLRELQQRYGVKILVVSGTDMGRRVRGSRTVQGLISRLGICAEVRPWRRERIAGDLVEADIGIAPIDTSRAFNLEKGAHRVQLYHIAGLPVVASSIASYRWWVRNGVDGFLCNGTSEWLQRLEELVSNWTLRAAMGTAGAARAWDRLAVETVAAECLRWLEDVGS
jgi:glycosyltransferase involved in cell wall biosynthesis